MKKLILMLVALAITATAYTQVIFNPKIGYNYSYFSEEFEDRSVEGKSGWQIGADLRFGDKVFFSPGIHYFESENRIESLGNIDVSGNDITFDIKALRIPAVVGIDLLEGRRIGLRAYTGPNLTLVLDNDEAVFDVDEIIYKDMAWGYNAGVGIDFGVLTLDLNHEWGLTNVFEPDNIKSKNNRLFLSLGLLF
ncbi:MAG TPA: outer membrane beta-barrel protein [Saprospiraceae bacterium]|nr:outer membrane beta-barrel protein [Saprospiraceae bacterium]